METTSPRATTATAAATASAPVFRTDAGAIRAQEYHLAAAGRAWTILHAGVVLTEKDEQQLLNERDRIPYGVALWPSSIALAHDLIARAPSLRGMSLLELGAGTGLPGIVAATFGAAVVQTDRQPLPLETCRRNAERNGVPTIVQRHADWLEWNESEQYDFIVGADILYAEATQRRLAGIFASNLAPGGRILVADPLRRTSLRFLETLEAEGWGVAFTKWTVGGNVGARPVGVFELTLPT